MVVAAGVVTPARLSVFVPISCRSITNHTTNNTTSPTTSTATTVTTTAAATNATGRRVNLVS